MNLEAISIWLRTTLLPYGGFGLMVLAICDSSFFSLPEINDVLLMTFAMNEPQSMIKFALLTTLGSLIGCSLLYAVGRKGGEAFLRNHTFIASAADSFQGFCVICGYLRHFLAEIPYGRCDRPQHSLFFGGDPGCYVRSGRDPIRTEKLRETGSGCRHLDRGQRADFFFFRTSPDSER